MLRVLYLDIETSLTQVLSFGIRKQYITDHQIVEPSHIMCWTAKWKGKNNKPIFYSNPNSNPTTERRMLVALRNLLDEADLIIHYNGKSFDNKVIRWHLMKNKITPPSPYQQLDLYSIMKTAAPESRKLDYISKEFGIGSKLEHEGFDLWKKCLHGDKQAWTKMKAYNIQDVQLVERLHDYLHDWLPAIAFDDVDACEHPHLKASGYYRTKQSIYIRNYCPDCKHYMRGAKISGNKHMVIPV